MPHTIGQQDIARALVRRVFQYRHERDGGFFSLASTDPFLIVASLRMDRSHTDEDGNIVEDAIAIYCYPWRFIACWAQLADASMHHEAMWLAALYHELPDVMESQEDHAHEQFARILDPEWYDDLRYLDLEFARRFVEHDPELRGGIMPNGTGVVE